MEFAGACGRYSDLDFRHRTVAVFNLVAGSTGKPAKNSAG